MLVSFLVDAEGCCGCGFGEEVGVRGRGSGLMSCGVFGS